MPFAAETSRVFGPEALSLLEDIGRQIRAETEEPRSFPFLLQVISVAIQRGNAACVSVGQGVRDGRGIHLISPNFDSICYVGGCLGLVSFCSFHFNCTVVHCVS